MFLSTEDYIGFNEVEVTSQNNLNYLLHLSVTIILYYICVGNNVKRFFIETLLTVLKYWHLLSLAQ